LRSEERNLQSGDNLDDARNTETKLSQQQGEAQIDLGIDLEERSTAAGRDVGVDLDDDFLGADKCKPIAPDSDGGGETYGDDGNDTNGKAKTEVQTKGALETNTSGGGNINGSGDLKGDSLGALGIVAGV